MDRDKAAISSLAESELLTAESDYYIRYIFDVLIKLKLEDKQLIDRLVCIKSQSEKHEYRNGLYQLMVDANCVDNYYYYGLDGIDCLLNHNKDVRHSFSEVELEKFLLRTEEVKHFRLLLRKLSDNNWINSYRFQEHFKRNFIRPLLQKAIDLYKADNLLVLDMIKLLKVLDRHEMKEDFQFIEDFFVQTGTNHFYLRFLLNKSPRVYAWDFAFLIDEYCIDIFFYLFEEGDIDVYYLRSVDNALRNKGDDKLYQKFKDSVVAMLGDDLYDKSEQIRWKAEEEFQLRKIENDSKYIASRAAFLKGVELFFNAFGKESIEDNDLIYSPGERSEFRKIDSEFIRRLLIAWMPKDTNITLSTIKRSLSTEDRFNFFRASEILLYSKDNANADKFAKILKRYYNREIQTADFKQTFKQTGAKVTFKRKEVLLGEIFEKHQFSTPASILTNMIWLDTAGANGILNASVNNRRTLSQLIIENLDEDGLNLLKQRILENLNSDIALDHILGTHIELCKHLDIYESRERLLKLIKSNKLSDFNKEYAFKNFLKLGGDENELVDSFRNISFKDSRYLSYVIMLKKQLPDIIQNSLEKCFSSTTATTEEKIQAAKHLSENGHQPAFAFLINELAKNKIAPYSIQSGYKPYNVDTNFALEELDKVAYLLLDEEANKIFSGDSPRHFILEIIYGLAAKSEEDLILVEAFLNKAAKQLDGSYKNVYDLNWYIERIFENYRNAENAKYTIQNIQSKLSSINL